MNIVPYPEPAYNLDIGVVNPYTIESEAKAIVWLSTQTRGGILEIGCANGYLTRALANHNIDRTIYALDWTHNPGLSEHQESERPDVVASRALHMPNVIAIDGDSKRFDYPSGIGFVFVDGDHTSPGVDSDSVKVLNYRNNEALLQRKVVIAWHDYRPESQWQGVAPLLDEWSNDYALNRIENTPIVVLGWP